MTSVWTTCEAPGCTNKICLWGVPRLCYPHGVEATSEAHMAKLYSDTHQGRDFNSEALSEPQVMLAPFCERHRFELVKRARYGQSDPWRVLIVMAQIAMFQGATATPSVHKRVSGDVEKIEELGCLACRLPHKWDHLLDAAKDSLTKVKSLGESWVRAANEAAKEATKEAGG